LDGKNNWTLPLASLVLASADGVNLPLNFLNVYTTILQKFPGPPIEALGRTISYLQAIFTESPGFHPFITHLSTESTPANEFIGTRVAEDLERRLIKTVQHLFSFFYGDISNVKQYLDACRAELIPRPLFILSTDQSANERMINGVQGYNNGVQGGAKLWQSPAVWSSHFEQQALKSNTRKCIETINRKRTWALPNVAGGCAPVPLNQRTAQQFPPLQLPPFPQQCPPAPQFSLPLPQQPPFPLGPPNQIGQITPITPLRAPQPPQIFHVPPPQIQMQIPAPNPPLPQPNFGPPAPIPAPIPAHPQQMQPPPHTMPIITRSASAPGTSFKDDITRLETQMARLLHLVEAKSRH
jgi:hypothetical protein